MQILTSRFQSSLIRNVSLDVDGTITFDDLGTITPALRDGIVHASKTDIQCTINSARTWQGTRQCARQISEDPKVAPWEIAGGGVFITKPGDSKPYLINYFSDPQHVFNTIRDVIHRSAPADTLLRGLSLDQGYHNVSLIDGFSKDIVVYAAKFSDGEKNASLICDQLRQMLPINLAEVFWYRDHVGETCWVQISPGGISKGSSLDTIEREELKILQSHSAHAGDSWSDICAFRQPGSTMRNERLAIVVETAPDEMITLADVRIRPPEEGGVEAFYQMLLETNLSSH